MLVDKENHQEESLLKEVDTDIHVEKEKEESKETNNKIIE